MNLLAAIAQLQPSKDSKFINDLHFVTFGFLDESHELLSRDHATNAPSIIIHTCDDSNNSVEIDNNLRQKLVRPTLVQTKRPPINSTED